MTPQFSDAPTPPAADDLPSNTHWWHGYPLGDGTGVWVCACGGVCDHERPCACQCRVTQNSRGTQP